MTDGVNNPIALSLEGVRPDERSAVLCQPLPQHRIIEQFANPPGQGYGIFRWHEEPVLAILDNMRP